MPSTPLLIDLAFSAWSEKARWALDWKGFAYRRKEYLPMIGDRELRRLSGQEEVPVLVLGDGRAIADSTRIALFAEDSSEARALLPKDARARADALRWQDWAGEVLSPCLRTLIGDSLARDSAAAHATIHPDAPFWVRWAAPVAVPIGVRGFLKAYDVTPATIERARWRLPILLGELGAALDGGSRTFLTGESFSLADLAVASALALLSPPSDQWLPRPMPAALRRAFTLPEAEAFSGLVAWRDDLYKRFRRPAA
jgi:glutathione S-transferase